MIYALVKRDTGELKYHFFDRAIAMKKIWDIRESNPNKKFAYEFICFPSEDGTAGQPIELDFNKDYKGGFREYYDQ